MPCWACHFFPPDCSCYLWRSVATVEPPTRDWPSAEGDRVTFVIPPPRFSFASLLPVGFTMIFSAVLAAVQIWSTASWHSQRWTYFACVAAVLIGIGIFLLAAIALSRHGSIVEASPDGLRVTFKGLLFSRTQVISSDDLEELRFKSTTRNGGLFGIVEMGTGREQQLTEPSLEAVSDKAISNFGAGLSGEELEWIRAVILKAVTK